MRTRFREWRIIVMVLGMVLIGFMQHRELSDIKHQLDIERQTRLIQTEAQPTLDLIKVATSSGYLQKLEPETRMLWINLAARARESSEKAALWGWTYDDDYLEKVPIVVTFYDAAGGAQYTAVVGRRINYRHGRDTSNTTFEPMLSFYVGSEHGEIVRMEELNPEAIKIRTRNYKPYSSWYTWNDVKGEDAKGYASLIKKQVYQHLVTYRQ
jgi:hypothetical protein